MNLNEAGYLVEEMSQDSLLHLNTLVGHTPFSFFQDFTRPVVIFNYYETYTINTINEICEAIGQRFDTDFEYLVNPEVNAGCCYSHGKNKVILYEGAILSIYSFASILACKYRTVTRKTETDKRHTVHDIEVNCQHAPYPDIKSTICISEIEEDNIIAEYIAMVAVKFIISHEIGHILGGHLLYRQDKGDSNASFYMAETTSFEINKLDMQAMEIDADTFAACQVLSLLETDLLYDELLKSTVLDETEIYKLIGSAIQCVFFLVGVIKRQWADDDPTHSHPSALTRVNLLLDTCRGTITGENTEKKWGYIIKGVIAAHKHLCDYFNKEFYEPEKFVFDVLGKSEYGMMILDHWRSIKKDLSKYTKLPYL